MTIEHHSAPDPGHGTYQQVVNVSWPLRDENGPHARNIPDQPTHPRIEARLVFETDGESIVSGVAVRKHGRCICVNVHDPRLQVAYVWLDQTDVRFT